MFTKKFIAIVTLFALFVLSGLGCKKPSSSYEMGLEMWGTFDNSNAFAESFDAYNNINDHVNSVSYRKLTLESYKNDLLSALAAGNGPDVFMIHNSWIPDFVDKIVPMPEYMSTEKEFRDTFVDVAADDCIVNGQIYCVPLSIDSLALYYNKDIFNAVGITRPPQTWKEFDAAVKTLTHVDEFGNIEQSGAAIGTAENVNRSPDILTVMMLQNGTEMSDPATGRVLFAEPVSDTNTKVPSEAALAYYTSFANATSQVYTWNKKKNYSIDDFYEGHTAMMINYSWHYDTIKAKNQKLNFAVADLPQIALDPVGQQSNFANYWVFVVAKNKQIVQNQDAKSVPITDVMRIHESWQLLRAITYPSANGITIMNAVDGTGLVYPVDFDLTEKYLEKTKKPAARRDLVEKQKNDVRLGAFARGNLIARTWWRNDAGAVDAIFADMIDSVNTGKLSVHQAIKLGAKRVQQLMKQPENSGA